VTGLTKISDLCRILPLSIALLATACGGAADETEARNDAAFRQWALPDRLHEISGLALTSDERLLAMTDEEAIIYEIDYESGRLVKAFAFGEPVLKGDFEGIAVLQDRVWLMTSTGMLYSALEGGDGERVDYERYVTKLDDECEFEGLAELPDRGTLALICKDAKKKKRLQIFEWQPGDGVLRRIELPEKTIEKALDKKRVNPSGIVRDPAHGDWLVVASIQHAVFRLDDDGRFNAVIMRLDPERHPQAEGIAITRDGRLLLADEGRGGSARLSVYGKTAGTNKN